MENLVSLKDLRLKLTNYTKRVEEKGDSFLVLRKSKPVFKIIPVEDASWETIIDFTEIDPTGVPAKKVVEALKKINAEA